jgi:transcriptional regulator with XRE-family HTH domain
MGLNDLAESRFRENLRRERDSRKWSQAHLAQLLSAKGLAVYPTTIAKVEAGERAARIDEVVAIADVFGVSVDALLGRSSRRQRGDKALTINALAQLTQSTAVAVESLEAALRDRLAELDSFDLRKDETAAYAECERAGDALTEAAAETRKVAAKLARIQKRMVSEFLSDDSHNSPEDRQREEQ